MARIQSRKIWLATLLAGIPIVASCGANTGSEGEQPGSKLLEERSGESKQPLAGGDFAFAYVNHLGHVDVLNSWSSRAPNDPQPAASLKLSPGRVRVALKSVGTTLGGGAGNLRGHVQVQPDNSSGHRCQVVGWAPSGAHELVEVQCTTRNGTPHDTAFWVQFMRGPGIGGRSAYVALDASLSVGVTHTVPAHLTYNSNGGVNTIVKQSTGVFRVNLPTIWHSSGPMVQVTAATGATAMGQYCKILSDTQVGSVDFGVTVACFNAIGQAADAFFTLNAFVREHAGPNSAGAYGRATQVGTAEYFATGAFDSGINRCTSNQNVKAFLIPEPFGVPGSTERYRMNFGNMDLKRAVPHVTAQGDGNAYCTYSYSDTDTSVPTARVFVMCWVPSGSRIRSAYYASLSHTASPCRP
jgi:hypothetical protein